MALEFTATVKKGGTVGTDCDYLTWQAAITGLGNDLTNVTTIKVFTISASSATRIAAGSTLLGGTSGATGVCVLVDYAKSQIFIKTIAIAAFQSGETVTGSDTNTCVLSSAGDVPICGIRLDAGAIDTTAVTITGFTTSAINYVRCYASAAGVATMPYTTTGYRLEIASGVPLTVNEEFTRIERISIKYTAPSSANAGRGINFSVTSSTGDQRVDGCVIVGVMHASNTTQVYGIRCANNEKLTVRNTYLIGWTNVGNVNNTALSANGKTVRAYNVSVINSATGFSGDTNLTCINCLYDGGSSGNQVGFSGTLNAATDYNSSNDATATGTHSRNSQTFTYVNAGSSDYTLAAGDAGAKDFGTDLSGIGTFQFTNDFNNATRSGSWDIGATETAGATYNTSWPAENITLGDVQLLASIVGAPSADNVTLGASFAYDFVGGSGSGTGQFLNRFRRRRD